MERKESNRENGELRFNPRKITFWLKKLKLYHKHKGEKVILEIEKKTLVYSSEGQPFKQNNDNKPNLEISW